LQKSQQSQPSVVYKISHRHQPPLLITFLHCVTTTSSPFRSFALASLCRAADCIPLLRQTTDYYRQQFSSSFSVIATTRPLSLLYSSPLATTAVATLGSNNSNPLFLPPLRPLLQPLQQQLHAPNRSSRFPVGLLPPMCIFLVICFSVKRSNLFCLLGCLSSVGDCPDSTLSGSR
ncbi:hypothetical protein B296_00049663, partial [Ensete ventricosum]